MQYAKLGDTGLIVSRLCLGVMTFGVNTINPALGKVDGDTARKMVDRSIEAGINFFDTANVYSGGQSETMLGEALGVRRHDVVIASKAGFRTGPVMTQGGLSRGALIAACEASLKRLNTDYIDLYQVHKEDVYTPLDETLAALDDLVRAGKVRYVGFSNWPAWRAAKAVTTQRANGWARFASAQLHYSLLIRDIEHELGPFLQDSGLGMMVWSPLAGGFLSGKYTRENMKQAGNRHAAFDIVPFGHEAGFALVECLREIAAAAECTVAQLSLAWLLSKRAVTSVIIGSAKVSQLEDNLGAAEVKLSAKVIEDLDALTTLKPLYPNWFNSRLVDATIRDGLAASTAAW